MFILLVLFGFMKTQEIVNLILDLGLVPKNYQASEFYSIVELENLRRENLSRDMRALSLRNRKRKKEFTDVFESSDYCAEIPFE